MSGWPPGGEAYDVEPVAGRMPAHVILPGSPAPRIEETTMSDAENTPAEEPAAALPRFAKEQAFLVAFTAIMDGLNREAAKALGDLSPENLTELHVICGDVQTMAEAALRRRDPAERFAAACAKADADPREQQRIADIAALVVAEDIIYEQAQAATARGDKDTALSLLRWCAPLGIGDSARMLANALEDAGDLAEARVWYARAACGGSTAEGSG